MLEKLCQIFLLSAINKKYHVHSSSGLYHVLKETWKCGKDHVLKSADQRNVLHACYVYTTYITCSTHVVLACTEHEVAPPYVGITKVLFFCNFAFMIRKALKNALNCFFLN